MKMIGARPALESAIAAFEEEQQIALPESYRRFIGSVGGGMPVPDCYLDTKRDIRIYVGFLFPLDSDRMKRQLFAFPPPRASRFLPIGTDGGGNYFLVHLDEGDIYYWDQERHDRDLDPQGLLRLAPDVDAFVHALVADPDDRSKSESEIEEMSVIAKAGTRPEALRFIEKNGLGRRGSDGFTLAEKAARSGNLAVLQLCLELGAPLSCLLHQGVRSRDLELIEFLIKAGAEVNEINGVGETPLDLVIFPEPYDFLENRGGVHAKRRGRPPHLRR